MLAVEPLSLNAQNYVKGVYIVNANSKVPLQDVSMQCIDGNFNAITDDNGFINLKALPVNTKKNIRFLFRL